MRIARFGAVGVANTFCDYGIFSLLVTLGAMPQLANAASITTAATFSFLANRHFTFVTSRGDTPLGQQILRHATVTLSGLVLSAAIIAALVAHVEPLVAKAMAIPTVFLWNYGLSSRWVWARGR